MTWEDIYKKLCERAINDTSPLGWEVALVLKEELGDCIIIKKGESRHKYADVLHEWIEGSKVECRYLANDSFEWKNNITLPSLDYEYRIKPSEPVYEWQWLATRRCDNVPYSVHRDGRYFTDIEAEDFDLGSYSFLKIEETKRERKNA